jgi:outer membrane protein assembly factor BamD (BamD/ComL family)
MRESKIYLTTLAVLLVALIGFDKITLAIPSTSIDQTKQKSAAQLLEQGNQEYQVGQLQVDQTKQKSAEQLLEQGNQEYQAGQLQAAIYSWQNARDIYQQQQDRQGERHSFGKLRNGLRLFSAISRSNCRIRIFFTDRPISQQSPD